MHAPDALQTARLRLVRPTEFDYEDLARMHLDSRMMKTLGGLRDRERSRGDLQRMMAHWDAHGFGLYFVKDGKDARFLGRAGIKRVHVNGRDEVEIGWSIVADDWGRGLATEAGHRLLDVAFGDLGLPDLVSFTLPHNLASRRVMEKLRMTYERDGTYAGLPHVFYRLRAPTK
jgi:ribosomal-protein-alanine N-acetyltransferase